MLIFPFLTSQNRQSNFFFTKIDSLYNYITLKGKMQPMKQLQPMIYDDRFIYE